jgi:hypothetical protein
MAKRLQVILQDPEYKEIQRMARLRHMTIAEWVRQALARARNHEPLLDVGKKLAAIRAAVRNNFPTAEINDMLAEIESGYLSGSHSDLDSRDKA